MGLDTVELVIAIEETFDLSIPNKDLETMTTPRHIIKYVQERVGSTPRRNSCLSQRAFYKVRSAITSSSKASRKEVRPNTRIGSLFPYASRDQDWKTFVNCCGLGNLPKIRFGRSIFYSPTRVRDLVASEVSRMAEELKTSDNWSDAEVRSVVRLIVSEQLNIEKFSDDDRFVEELGID